MLVKKIKPFKNTLFDFAKYLKANNVPIDVFFTKVNIDKQYEVIAKYINSVLWYRMIIKDSILYIIKDDPILVSEIVYKQPCDNDKEYAIECTFKYFEENNIRAYGNCPF